MPRDQITLECEVCNQQTYTTTKNRRNQPSRVEYKKYCRFCRKHAAHKEAR